MQALRGSDVVGSSVRLKIRKPSGKLFECTVQRGAIARIEAIGELFLMLTEVVSSIQNHEKLIVGDILGYGAFSCHCCYVQSVKDGLHASVLVVAPRQRMISSCVSVQYRGASL